jgi:hypothetical protein
MRKVLFSLFVVTFLFGCDSLSKVVDEAVAQTQTTNNKLTEQEVINGLKEALNVGTDKAVGILSRTNGYYGDAAVKILLPPDAQEILKHKDHPLLKAVGISKMIDDVILRMNRAAEDAAKSATPIFKNAVKSMTITDAWNILKGNDTAATHYFRQKTYNSLVNLYKPVMKKSLDKPMVGGISANVAWKKLTTAYNNVAGRVGWRKVNTDLTDYATRKGVNGLFVKIADQEKQIRKNPAARINDILQRVFNPNNW